jgi:transcriptional regulator with XRE-family HTH domain
MKKHFSTLRCALMMNGTTQHALANELGLSPSSLSKRFTGKIPWTTQEAYSVLQLLDRPDSELQVYFPRDGLSKFRRNGALIAEGVPIGAPSRELPETNNKGGTNEAPRYDSSLCGT